MPSKKKLKTSLVTCYKAQWQCFPVSFLLLRLLPISTQGSQEGPKDDAEDGDEDLDVDDDDENDDDNDDNGYHLKSWVCVGKHSESCFTVPWGLLQVDDHLHQKHDDDDDHIHQHDDHDDGDQHDDDYYDCEHHHKM